MLERPRVKPGDGPFLVGVAAVFAVVFAVRVLYGGPEDAISILFVIPIALLAVRLGTVAALLGAGLAFALLVAWVLVDDVSLGWAGFVSRAVAFVVAAGAIGVLEERQRETQSRQHALAVHDGIVQALTVAQYSFERGLAEEGVAKLDDALERAREVVTAELGESPAPGDLRLGDR